MSDFIDERRYAWRLIRAARQGEDVSALLERAMDAGLDRAQLIVELSRLGGRLLTLCEPSSGEVCLT